VRTVGLPLQGYSTGANGLEDCILGGRTWWAEMFGTEERWQMFVVAEGQ
jgi:hypothetical protein